MKKLVLSATLLLATCAAFGNVVINYENKDDRGYFMKVKIDGAYKEVKIESGSRAYITIQGGNSSCYFVTSCGEVEVNTGDIITIKDRCITVYKSLQQNY
ncbi:hypothetical protein GCM10023093_23470 [Nemorincola caseinilytica]|uniref:Lipoprotein n=1 Tax=Nemorincola caseinilytica TaxID=2054315 RepID=A0ABP8NJM8_9BACT